MTPRRPPTPQELLGLKIRGLMIDADVTQRDLAAEIGIAVRGKPYVESQASAWLNGGREMSKEQIMAAERILGVRPGTLTQELGYVPTSTETVASVEVSIMRDPDLGPKDKEALLTQYRELRELRRRWLEGQAAKQKKRGRR